MILKKPELPFSVAVLMLGVFLPIGNGPLGQTLPASENYTLATWGTAYGGDPDEEDPSYNSNYQIDAVLTSSESPKSYVEYVGVGIAWNPEDLTWQPTVTQGDYELWHGQIGEEHHYMVFATSIGTDEPDTLHIDWFNDNGTPQDPGDDVYTGPIVYHVVWPSEYAVIEIGDGNGAPLPPECDQFACEIYPGVTGGKQNDEEALIYASSDGSQDWLFALNNHAGAGVVLLWCPGNGTDRPHKFWTYKVESNALDRNVFVGERLEPPYPLNRLLYDNLDHVKSCQPALVQPPPNETGQGWINNNLEDQNHPSHLSIYAVYPGDIAITWQAWRDTQCRGDAYTQVFSAQWPTVEVETLAPPKEYPTSPEEYRTLTITGSSEDGLVVDDIDLDGTLEYQDAQVFGVHADKEGIDWGVPLAVEANPNDEHASIFGDIVRGGDPHRCVFATRDGTSTVENGFDPPISVTDPWILIGYQVPSGPDQGTLRFEPIKVERGELRVRAQIVGDPIITPYPLSRSQMQADDPCLQATNVLSGSNARVDRKGGIWATAEADVADPIVIEYWESWDEDGDGVNECTPWIDNWLVEATWPASADFTVSLGETLDLTNERSVELIHNGILQGELPLYKYECWIPQGETEQVCDWVRASDGEAIVGDGVPKVLSILDIDAQEGWVTVIVCDDEFCDLDPVEVYTVKVECGLYQGDVIVEYPINEDTGEWTEDYTLACPFNEKVRLRFDVPWMEDGEADGRQFQWKWSEGPAFVGQEPEFWNWHDLGGTEAVKIYDGASDFTMRDLYYRLRYTGYDACQGGAEHSEWTTPQPVYGWIKRVADAYDIINARLEAFHNGETGETYVSTIANAGPRYDGTIALNCDPVVLSQSGVIEVLEQALKRCRDFTIDAADPYGSEDLNQNLLLISSRLAELYLLLGNEAYADAMDPTIGGEGLEWISPEVMFSFENQMSTLLSEELGLLRGRNQMDLEWGAPEYNRLRWNFTGGDGEVAYVENYGVSDFNEASTEYPQGHGDAWGHYLSSSKYFYRLLQSDAFDWVDKPERVSIGGGKDIDVDYRYTRTFARAAAARANTGADIIALSFREQYTSSPEDQLQSYEDSDPDRSWGVHDWATRSATGAYLDWAMANSLLPAEDTFGNCSESGNLCDPSATGCPGGEGCCPVDETCEPHEGIARVDRLNTPELNDIAANLTAIQNEVDLVDSGLNPIGLTRTVVPFDINVQELDQGKTHFEQVYERAVQALENTNVVLLFANKTSERLRTMQDEVDEFEYTVQDREADFKGRLIELFGYPYDEDIDGVKYPIGYDGPDIYHYDYVDVGQLTGREPENAEYQTIFRPKVETDANGALRIIEELIPVSYHMNQEEGLVKPPEYTSRRAQGEIQFARSEIFMARAKMEQAFQDLDNLLLQIQDQRQTLEAYHNLSATKIWILNQQFVRSLTLNAAVRLLRQVQLDLRASANTTNMIAAASAEMLPTSIGWSSADTTSAARGTIRHVAAMSAVPINQVANQMDISVLFLQQMKEDLQTLDQIVLQTEEAKYTELLEMKKLEQLVRQIPGSVLQANMARETMVQAVERYRASVARGLRLFEDYERFLHKTVDEIRDYRYKDLAFRIFRNDALQKYRGQFDLAARYAYLAAKTFDYETNLLGSSISPDNFLNRVLKARMPGAVASGNPSPGKGLAGILHDLDYTFTTSVSPAIRFDNPIEEERRFSLRREKFRTRLSFSEHQVWRDTLEGFVIPDLRDRPDILRLCNVASYFEPGEPATALVIPFSTEIVPGHNFFGWPLAPNDGQYSPAYFTTKVRKVGLWFSNYNTSELPANPYAYLIPAGTSQMRVPAGAYPREVRDWDVVDQLMPMPSVITESVVEQDGWLPWEGNFAGLNNFGRINKINPMEVFTDDTYVPGSLISSSELVGRTVWNTEWVLVIPGKVFNQDPAEGIRLFIHGQSGNGGVSDIKVLFDTYAYRSPF